MNARAALRLAVVSVMPQMFDAIRAGGVTAKAVDAGFVDLKVFNPRDYTSDRHRA